MACPWTAVNISRQMPTSSFKRQVSLSILNPSLFTFIFQFMLLSNIAVAQHIAVHLPEQALLRRHDNPIERRLVRYPPVHILP